MIIRDWNETIPGFREAVNRENRERDIPWLGLTEFVCGVELMQFAPRHYLFLTVAQSPFILGGTPIETDIAKFFWVCSTKFIAGNTRWIRWRRDRFIKRLRKLDWGQCVSEIGSYIDDAFSLGPGGGGSSKSYSSCISGIVDRFAFEYGWSEEVIVTTPFKKLFQLERNRKLRTYPDTTFSNPSDRLKQEWLRNRNKQDALN